MRKWVIYLFLIPIVSVLLLCSGYFLAVRSSSLAHDRTLDQFEAEFQKTEHLSGTSLVKRNKQVGLLWTGGNGCRYFVGELRRYSQSREAVKLFYAGKKVTTPFYSDVAVAFVEDRKVVWDKDWLNWFVVDLSDWGIPETEFANNLYVVYILNSGEEPGLDLRCT